MGLRKVSMPMKAKAHSADAGSIPASSIPIIKT